MDLPATTQALAGLLIFLHFDYLAFTTCLCDITPPNLKQAASLSIVSSGSLQPPHL
jgi:hypothetical protein